MLKQLRNAASEKGVLKKEKEMSKPVVPIKCDHAQSACQLFFLTMNLMFSKITALYVCVCSFPLDAILNMVNNIAANVLGSKPELEGGAKTGGINP